MRKLFLDLGNSRFKWVINSELVPEKVEYRSYSTQTASENITEIVASVYPAAKDAQWVIASVKGDEFNQQLTAVLNQEGISHLWVEIGDSPVLAPSYSDWSQFGIDRYLNLVAAKQEYDLPLIVVSVGTAVTLDLLGKEGRHEGGCIFPGLSLLRQSLTSGTAQIEQASTEGSILAKSTAEAVAAGTRAGLFGAITTITTEMQKKNHSEVTILLTGGGAESMNQALPLPTRVDTLLLFKGMDVVR